MGGICVAHGKIGSHPQFMNHYSSKNAGTITMTYSVDTTPHDVEPQPYSLTAGWLGLGHKGNATMEGYRVVFPFYKSRQTGDDSRFLPPVDTAPRDGATIFFHSRFGLSLSGCAARRARDTEGERAQQTGGGRCGAPDEDRAPPPFQKPFNTPSTPTNRGRKPNSPASTPHRTCVETLAS